MHRILVEDDNGNSVSIRARLISRAMPDYANARAITCKFQSAPG